MFFDIGANIGSWSLSNIQNTNKIIAIEAIKQTYDVLLNNINLRSNIIPLNYAVCKYDD